MLWTEVIEDQTVGAKLLGELAIPAVVVLVALLGVWEVAVRLGTLIRDLAVFLLLGELGGSVVFRCSSWGYSCWLFLVQRLGIFAPADLGGFLLTRQRRCDTCSMYIDRNKELVMDVLYTTMILVLLLGYE